MNLLIHLLNSLLIYQVASALGFRRELSMWAGTLFMVMTCHAEAAAWISGRADLIATFFCLLSLNYYIRSRTQKNRRFLWLAYGAFILALTAKETAVVLPLLFIAYEWWRETGSRTSRQFIRNLMPSGIAFLILVAYLLVRMSVVGSLIGGYGASQHLKVEFLPTLLNIGMHCFKTLLPASLSDASPGGVSMLLIFGLAGFILFLLLSTLSSRPPVLSSVGERQNYPPRATGSLVFLILAFLISVLPTATLKLPLMMAFNDRFTYFPSVWIALLLCWCLNRVAGMPRAVIAGGLLMLYSTGTWQSIMSWAKAGQLAQAYLSSLEAVDSTRPLLFLSVPDSYRSAYIFRNGLPEAIELFVPHLKGQEVIILSKFTKRLDTSTAVEAISESSGEFRLTDPRDNFTPPERSPVLKVPIQYQLNEKSLRLPSQPAIDNYLLLIPGPDGFRRSRT